MIKYLTADEVITSWPKIEPLLQRVLDRFDYGSDPDDILVDVINGRRMVWSINDFEGVAVLSVTNLPNFSTLDVDCLAGDNMNEWLTPFINQLTKYAKVLGCKYVDSSGRKGWIKQLKQFGFKETSYDVRYTVDG